MKKKILLVFAFAFIVNLVKAQLPTGSYSDYFKEGNFLLLEENYDQALKNFLSAYNIDSSSSNINFNIGYCYLSSSTQKGKAEKYLAKAVSNISKSYTQDDPSEKHAPPLALFYYAKALHINYKFDEAIAQYDLFEKNYAKDKATKADVAYFRQQSVYAKELYAAPINVEIYHFDDSINSEYPDYSPVLSADERMMIYTTRRPNTTGGEKEANGMYNEDIVVSYKDDNDKWSMPVPISQNINTIGMEASINLTPDGQTLIVYKDAGDGGNGNIYYSIWDGKDWSSLLQFGSDINTKYWETHACLSADGNTLYFISDRPGGFGGRDIYRCLKLPNGTWAKAQNLGPTINTPYDEDGVFIHPDGVTMIFASRGHKSMGGFDIFFSTMDEEKRFSEPINMGYPINTPDDDVFFVTSPDGKRGYFSSSKDGGFGEKDIYMMTIPGIKEPPLALFKGQIIPADGEILPEDIVVVITDKETGDLIGTYKPKQNGTYATILPPNKNYNVSYQANGQEFYNEDLFVNSDVAYQEIRKAINLEPVTMLGKVAVKTKGVTLSAMVFNNSKEKKPLSNAKITLVEKGGAEVNYNTDDKGKKDGIVLAADKTYTIFAEADGKKSPITTFNTNGIKGAKMLNQMIYMDAKAPKTYDLALNVLVLDKKKHKPVSNARVVLTGNDGSKFETVTDEKGKVSNIELSTEVNYDLIAENNGDFSKKELFTTLNTKANKTYNKTLYVTGGTNANQSVACGTLINYKFNFGYNQNEATDAEDWNAFIDGLVTMTKSCSPTVKILSSASQVPTHAYSSNHELAKKRAENMEEKIKKAVAAKGGDASKLIFDKHWAVRGPQYAGDADAGKEKYGKYQYVRVSAK